MKEYTDEDNDCESLLSSFVVSRKPHDCASVRTINSHRSPRSIIYYDWLAEQKTISRVGDIFQAQSQILFVHLIAMQSVSVHVNISTDELVKSTEK